MSKTPEEQIHQANYEVWGVIEHRFTAMDWAARIRCLDGLITEFIAHRAELAAEEKQASGGANAS